MPDRVRTHSLSDGLARLHKVYASLQNTGVTMSAEAVRQFVSSLAVLTMEARRLETDRDRLAWNSRAEKDSALTLDGVAAMEQEARDMRAAAARGEELIAFARRGELKAADPRVGEVAAAIMAHARPAAAPPREFEGIVTNVVDMADYFGPAHNENDRDAVKAALRQIAETLGQHGIVAMLEDRL